MGIRFVDSILALVTAACIPFSFYLVGHGLENMTAWPWLSAGLVLLAGVGLGAITVRRFRSYAAHRRDAAGH